MLEESRIVLAAGHTVDDWSSGRSKSAPAVAAIDADLRRLESCLARLKKLTAPPAAQGLARACERVSAERRELLRQARGFVAGGDPSHAALQGYMATSIERTSATQTGWLRERLEATRRALQEKLRPRQLEFYRWQSQLLVLALGQVKIGVTAQRLAVLDQNVSLNQLQAQASQATQNSVLLRGKAERIQAPAWLSAPQHDALAEQLALARLCEAVELFTQDRSEDSVARVKHALTQLSKVSQAAEESSLQALADALKN